MLQPANYGAAMVYHSRLVHLCWARTAAAGLVHCRRAASRRRLMPRLGPTWRILAQSTSPSAPGHNGIIIPVCRSARRDRARMASRGYLLDPPGQPVDLLLSHVGTLWSSVHLPSLTCTLLFPFPAKDATTSPFLSFFSSHLVAHSRTSHLLPAISPRAVGLGLTARPPPS